MHSEKFILQGTDIVTAVIHIQKWMIITKRQLLCGLCWFKLSIHIAVMLIHYRFPGFPTQAQNPPGLLWTGYRLTFGSVLYPMNRRTLHLLLSSPNLQLPLHSLSCALFLSHFISPPPGVASIYLQSRTVPFPQIVRLTFLSKRKQKVSTYGREWLLRQLSSQCFVCFQSIILGTDNQLNLISEDRKSIDSL